LFTWPRLTLNSRFSCLSLLSAGITDLHHHAWQPHLPFTENIDM
jgi:hypothetical protein